MASDTPLIGLTGVARSGKDTAAGYLTARYGYVKHSFAEPIRRFVAHILGWSLEELEQRKEEPIEWLGGVTARHMMQTVGTEWGRRMIHPELWVKSCMVRAQQSLDAGSPVVISDVRFDNEGAAIAERAGEVWRVQRNGAGTAGIHVSEAGIAQELVARTIPNNSSFRVLAATIDAALADRRSVQPDVVLP